MRLPTPAGPADERHCGVADDMIPSVGAPGRGRLRIYLGAAPGVGTTYAMLDEGRRRAGRGTVVAIGAVDTRGRTGTASLLEGLAPPGGPAPTGEDGRPAELDLDALLRARPDVVLVDDLEQLNPPGSAHARRHEDVDALLDAGIDVIATLGLEHLESMADVVGRITGSTEPATVPDAWVRDADQVELVDMSPEALRRRLAHGNVYAGDEMGPAESSYFRPDNLATMRLLALHWVADWVEDRLARTVEGGDPPGGDGTRERVVVAITSAPGNDMVIRRAARIADRTRGVLLGVHVRPTEAGAPIAADLDRRCRLVEELGGTMHYAVGDDIAAALVEAARSHRATQVVVGASRRSRWQELTGGSVLNRLLRLAGDLDVHVISSDVPDDRSASSWHMGPWGSAPVPRRRRLVAWALVLVGMPAMTVALIWVRDDLGLATSLLLALGFVVMVSAVGGLAPGLVAAVAGAAVTNFHVVPPTGSLKINSATNVLALLVFTAVGGTVAVLVDRVALRSIESVRARSEAASLARAVAMQAVEGDPLPALVEELRASFSLEAVSVLRRGDDGWEVLASAGDAPPRRPEDGRSRRLGDDGGAVAVFRGVVPRERDPLVVDAFLDQLEVAVRRRDLQERATAAAALAEANAVRSGILQAVSHDLRTPLSGIKASVTSLLAEDLSFDRDSTRMFLQTIDDEVDRLDRVVGNLLDMSRLRAGSLAVQARPTALEEVVSAALDSLGTEPGLVEVDVAETLPLVAVDGALLERALANVTANALAVQPSGTPVRIEAGDVGRGEGRRVLLRVIDTGPGIPVAERAEALAPFQRLGDRSTQAGVGLGLAIADGFCAAMGASLQLDDTPGGGLTVALWLPLAAEAGPHTPRPAVGPTRAGSS